FYTFRAYFKTFWGEVRIPDEADAHGHGDHHDGHGGHSGPPKRKSYESPFVMTAPLMVLAVFAGAVGFGLGPMTHYFAHVLGKTTGWPHEEHAAAPGMNIPLMTVSTLVALAGMALAWVFYIQQPALPGKLAKSMQGLYQLSLNKFYLDEIYYALIVRPMEW